ncbi:MAG TPA: N-acetylglucosamine-6-phosphate deacetylase [Chitinophagaceae bacterium]|nr:N-acetylglucosamine-6-phosphate deacetylase [Chitinophagaceae bacterium]
MRQALTNTTVFTGKQTLTGVAVLTSDGKIDGFAYDSDIPSGYEVRDLNSNMIAAAFIDLQIYGGNEFLFSSKPSFEAIEATKSYCLQGGASKFLLTVATNSNEVYSKSITVAKQYLKEGGKNFLGLHIEGPWINTEKRGAHHLQFIHSPTMDEVKSLVEEAEGSVKIITLAPETVDEKIVDYLQANGIVVSAGHSNATYDQAMKGFEKIGIATHLFNAMSPLQSRAPGMVGAIYDHPSVISSIVADGIHVDFAALRISKKILGDRIFLITDAVAETSEGPYQHIFKNDRYVIPDGTLSGSALTIMKAVKNCVQHIGVDLEEALRMGSLYPAKVLGMENEVGLIEKNYEASFVVFDKELEVVEVIEG